MRKGNLQGVVLAAAVLAAGSVSAHDDGKRCLDMGTLHQVAYDLGRGGASAATAKVSLCHLVVYHNVCPEAKKQMGFFAEDLQFTTCMEKMHVEDESFR